MNVTMDCTSKNEAGALKAEGRSVRIFIPKGEKRDCVLRFRKIYLSFCIFGRSSVKTGRTNKNEGNALSGSKNVSFKKTRKEKARFPRKCPLQTIHNL